MPYSPPAYNAVNFNFSGAYSPPTSTTVNFNFGTGGGGGSAALPSDLRLKRSRFAIMFKKPKRNLRRSKNPRYIPPQPAMPTAPISEIRKSVIYEYHAQHKPWRVPPRAKQRWISINYAPARVTWDGLEVGYGEDGPARVTWLGLELARTIDPVIPYKPTLKASVLRAYVKRRPKIWQRQRAGHFVEIVQPPIPVISRLSTKILRAYKRRPKKYRRTIVGFTITFPPAHVSWIGAEAGYADESDGRVTWIGLETGYSPDGAARVTWNGLEVGYAPDTFARVTWNGIEAAYLPNGPARVSWIGLEVARPAVPNAQPRRVVFVTA